MELTDTQREQLDKFAALLNDEIGEKRYNEILEDAFGPRGEALGPACGYGPYCTMLCHLNINCLVRPVCRV